MSPGMARKREKRRPQVREKFYRNGRKKGVLPDRGGSGKRRVINGTKRPVTYGLDPSVGDKRISFRREPWQRRLPVGEEKLRNSMHSTTGGPPALQEQKINWKEKNSTSQAKYEQQAVHLKTYTSTRVNS